MPQIHSALLQLYQISLSGISLIIWGHIRESILAPYIVLEVDYCVQCILKNSEPQQRLPFEGFRLDLQISRMIATRKRPSFDLTLTITALHRQTGTYVVHTYSVSSSPTVRFFFCCTSKSIRGSRLQVVASSLRRALTARSTISLQQMRYSDFHPSGGQQ